MDTVVVVDTVIVIMSEASRNWWAVNAYWWVPVLTVFITLYGIYKSTKTSEMNTTNQIENSRKSTEKQIQTSTKNTDKQIENQNRENYKPCIAITKVTGLTYTPDKNIYVQYAEDKSEKYSPPKYEHALVELKNIGYGVASKINFDKIEILNIDKSYYMSNEKNIPKNDDVIFVRDLAAGDFTTIDMIIKIPYGIVLDKEVMLKYILSYNDLNENEYSSLHIIGLDNNQRDFICEHFPLKGTGAYEKKKKEVFSKKF